MANSTPPRKKITRRKPGSAPSKYYFDDNTQLSIIEYQEAVITNEEGVSKPDFAKRDSIYRIGILPAFSTLVENLINVYGYNVLYETRDDLRNECLEFLFTVIDKWKKEKGSKAFAYFNIVAKNWLTIRSKQNVKMVQSYVSLDNQDALSKDDTQFIEEFNFIPSVEDNLTNEDLSKNLKQLVKNLSHRTKTENEKLCIDAISTIVQNIDNIDLFSKRAVMLYIREITGMSSKQLSIVLSSLKKQYKLLKEESLQ